MKVRIEPGNIGGIITAPPSKSMTQRAYAAALLHRGTTILHNTGHSDDEMVALEIIQQLGAKIISRPDVSHLKNAGRLPAPIEIISDGVKPVSSQINCRESGLSARIFTPVSALSENEIMVDGTGSLPGRPMDDFGKVFSMLDVTFSSASGHLPLKVKGPLQARSFKMDGSGGSQFLSGLLFAVSAVAGGPVIIDVAGLKSKPYIDLTLEVLAHFGKPVIHNDYREFFINPALHIHKDVLEFNIEGDWSSAAGLLVAGAIAGDITVRNLRIASNQADRVILDVLRSVGAEVTVDNDTVSVKAAPLRSFDFDATNCPDLFPVLAVLAACCEGESYVTGVHRLFHKESNRAESISEMLQDFDVPYSIEDDMLCVTGIRKLQGTVINSYNDHRIVMAAAIGALKANGPVDILQGESINKSYPDFFNDLILCRGKCILT